MAAVGAVWDADGGQRTWSGGAVDYSSDTDRIAAFSQRGSDLDLLAPGVDIVGLDLAGGLTVKSGTSMATPLVVGAAVIARQAAEGVGTLLNPSEILALLRRSGVAVYDGDDEDDNVANTYQSYRRIDLAASVADATVIMTPDVADPAANGLAGDATGDGVVDAADYIVLKRNLGRAGGATRTDGDFDGDGDVDFDDFHVLMSNMGRTATPPSTADGDSGQVAPVTEQDGTESSAVSATLAATVSDIDVVEMMAAFEAGDVLQSSLQAQPVRSASRVTHVSMTPRVREDLVQFDALLGRARFVLTPQPIDPVVLTQTNPSAFADQPGPRLSQGLDEGPVQDLHMSDLLRPLQSPLWEK